MKLHHAGPTIVIAAAVFFLSLPLQAAITLTPVVTSGISSPVFVGNANDGSNRLFIVQQGGIISVLQPGSNTPTVFLDISTRISTGGERGLLGLAFHPQYFTNRRFFVFYTRVEDGDLVIAEYGVSPDPNVAITAETVLLTIPHSSFSNHNGGMIAFGPDTYLHIGVGDGGSANDPGNNGQNINSLLGKILRIDVNTPDPIAGTLYSSPPDNPFVAVDGRDEIFAFGMRNPWRFSFDRSTGQQWVGDVGQGQREEVDTPLLKGGNYGWRVFEGTFCTGVDPSLCDPGNYSFPLIEYSHTGGRCSITGGYVYRGTGGALPAGTYTFADFCTGEIFTWNGSSPSLLLDTSMNISSFGEDELGELYVVNLNGSIHRIDANLTTTTTSLVSSENPATAGTTVTFTATVSGSIPTGSVNFTDSGSTLNGCGAIPLSGSGNARFATCTTGSLTAGVHSIVATYSGDGSNAASASPPLSQVINPATGALVNSSFETPFMSNDYQYGPSGPGVGWNFFSGAGIQGNGSAWGALDAPLGSQTAFIQSQGSINQTLALNAGSYTLSFQAARRSYSLPDGGVQPIRVSVDGAQIGLITPASTSFSLFTLTFSIAGSGFHNLDFSGTDGSGDKSTFLDAVSLVPTAVASSLVNAGFETPFIGANYQSPSGPGVGWSFFISAGIQGNGSGFGAATAPEGTQTAYIQWLGRMSQSLTLNAGTYALVFQAARRAYSEPADSVQPVQVSVDGIPVGVISPPSTSFSGFAVEFSIGATGPHTIEFAGTDGNGDKSTFIDDVVITSGASPANPSFEFPALGNGWQYAPAGAGWSFSPSAGIQGNGSGWEGAAAPDGTQTAFIQSVGVISQTLSLNAGNYTLSLQAAQRAHAVPLGGVQPILVSVDGTPIALISPASTSFAGISIPFSITTSGTHTLEFAGTDVIGDKTTFLDAIGITP